MQLRSALLLVHRWAGVVSAAFLFVVAVTGAALVFEDNIDRVLNPSTAYVTPQHALLPVETMIQRVTASRPGERVTSVRVPARPTFSYEFALSSRLAAFVDPYTGTLVGVRNREKSLARFIHLLHTRFVAGETGELFVGWLTVLTMLMAITGLILWWPRRIFSVGRYSSWRRTNFDLHSALGFWASLVILVMSLSGVIIAFEAVTDPLVEKLNATPKENLEKLTSTPVPGGRRIRVDDALRTAREMLPGAFASSINVPSRPTEFYRVLLKFPEDRTPAGRSRVYIDQFSGRVLAVENTRTAPAGTRILNLKRSAHTGDIFGAPTQALYFVASLALAGQTITGVLIWWKPRRAEVRRESPAA